MSADNNNIGDKLKVVELFAGVGGFRLGIERALLGRQVSPVELQSQAESGQSARPSILPLGDSPQPAKFGQRQGECVFANEWDKYAAQTYNKNFGGSIDTRDITTIGTDEIPDHDLLVGGFPCQAFSVAGKRKGFDETRGTLFFEIARILADKKPAHLLLENVKGLLSHDSGRTFQTILGVLADLGYRVEWQVLNSKDFGVPQNRERVFIIGHFGACCGRQVFPITASGGQYIQEGEQPETPAFWDDRNKTIRKISPTLDQPEHNSIRLITERQDSQQEQAQPDPNDTNRRTTSATRQPLRFLERNQKNIEGDYAYTVDSTNTGGVAVANRIRRLTPVECERLQGFPDGWTEGVSDTQRYKQMGNAVTVNVIETIAGKLCLGTI